MYACAHMCVYLFAAISDLACWHCKSVFVVRCFVLLRRYGKEEGLLFPHC